MHSIETQHEWSTCAMFAENDDKQVKMIEYINNEL